jgi:hypothetical protein
MLIALALATATIATPPLGWAPVAPLGPLTSMTLSVHAAPARRSIVPQVLDEAAAIWRGSGLTLRWAMDDGDSEVSAAAPGCALRVTIEDGPPAASGTMMPLGWIRFDASNDPTDEIHLSFNNAQMLMQDAIGAAVAFRLTRSERTLLLSRALGRALAHEIGHYLLGSRSHSRTGLMQSERPATDFFTPGRERFAIAPAERTLIASRWTRFSTPSNQ